MNKSKWMFLASVLFLGVIPFQHCAQSFSTVSQSQSHDILNPVSDPLPVNSQPSPIASLGSNNNGIPYFGNERISLVFQSTDTACPQSGEVFSKIEFRSPTRALLLRNECADLAMSLVLDSSMYSFDTADPTLLTYQGHSYRRISYAPVGSEITSDKVFYRGGETIRIDWARPGVTAGFVELVHGVTRAKKVAFVRGGDSGFVLFEISDFAFGIWNAEFVETRASGGNVKVMGIALSIEP